MGTWGVHSFDNDTALDLLDQVRGLDQPVDQADLVRDTLQTVFVSTDQYLDADDAYAAIAAAEIVAGALGQSRTPTQKTFDLEASFKFYDDTVGMALTALDHVMERPSEVLELWAETDQVANFAANIQDLRDRLSQAAQAHDLPCNFDPPKPDQTPDDQLRAEVDQVYDDMMGEIERLADQAGGDAQVEFLRHLTRKMHLIHTDITNMRYFVVDSLDHLTARISELETSHR